MSSCRMGHGAGRPFGLPRGLRLGSPGCAMRVLLSQSVKSACSYRGASGFRSGCNSLQCWGEKTGYHPNPVESRDGVAPRAGAARELGQVLDDAGEAGDEQGCERPGDQL